MQTGYQMDAGIELRARPLPFAPEPIAALAARYPAALARVWNADTVYAFHSEGLDADRPTLHREHILDTEYGIRLGVSRESSREYAGGIVDHVSASLHPDTLLEAELAPLPRTARAPMFLKRLLPLLASITGREDWTLIGATVSGVFHYHAPVRNPV